MQEGSFADRLKEFMEANRLTQEAIANVAKVSQSSVSRALRRNSVRHGKAGAKLFIYMQQHLSAGFVSQGKGKVVEAFESIWDGSEEHATAIARIIKASDGLRPAEHSKEGD